MSGLGLTPNEIVGYRIKADWHSFNVVLVRKHGPSSKNAGQEYETPLAYCKSLPFAVSALISRATRHYAELDQSMQEKLNGTVAAYSSLSDAIVKAEAEALKAVKELETRIEKSGILKKDLVQALGDAID